MKYCPYCGTPNEDQNMICEACGAQLTTSEEPAPQAEPATYAPVQNAAPAQQPYQQPAQQYQPTQQPYQQTYQQQTQLPFNQTYQQPSQYAPERYSNGGLIAWSVITILLCTVPGIIAMINACGINSCTTAAQQQGKIKTARVCCIIGTVLGVISLLVSIIANLNK